MRRDIARGQPAVKALPRCRINLMTKAITMYQPTDPVTTEAEIRSVIAGRFESQEAKVIDHVDELCRAWIESATFLTMATCDSAGNIDVSPKGDPAGFVRVVDRKTLAIPDRPGNHRYDSFLNILETGRVGLVFLVPNRNEVVRVNGSAQIVRDMALRETLAINGRVPDFVVLVRVEEAFYHCGKAVIRSRLWSPCDLAPGKELPSYAEALIEHAKLTVPLEEMKERLQHNDDHRLYDE